MKKIIFIIIPLFFLTNPLLIVAQGFQGKAYYQTKTTFKMKLDSSKVSTEQQKMFEEMMKKRFEKVYELSFNTSESVYKEEEQLQQPGKGNMRMFGGFGSGKNYKNIKTKIFANEKNFMGKQFLIKDSLEVFDWKFEDESKMIGKNLCFKATATKEIQIPKRAFRFRKKGKKKEDNLKPKDSIKKLEITAWYAIDIPVNHGPGDYWGLPGLILEVNSGKTQIVCTKIIINPKEKTEIKAPTKGEVVSQKEYREIVEKKMHEMQEMYGGGRRKGGKRGAIFIEG